MSAIKRRRCPVPGCGATLRLGHLMCKSCWGAVPRAEQAAVNQTWTTVRRAARGVTMETLPAYRTMLARYRTATEAAIAAALAARP